MVWAVLPWCLGTVSYVTGCPDPSESVRIEQICCRSVLGVFQHSGPSVYREAAKTARNLANLGIYICRAPFFGRMPSVDFLAQRYRGTWPFSRSPRSPQSNFNRVKRLAFSRVADRKCCRVTWRRFSHTIR